MMIAHHDDNERRGGSGEMGDHDPRTAIDASNPGLIASPLDFLFAEHLRQRQFAKILTLIADGVINRKTITSAIAFVKGDLALHILDEEICFFPTLQSMCEPEDKIDAILGLLAAEHREDEAASEAVVKILQQIAGGGRADEAGRLVLRDFADHLRHHIALENGVLLPIARARMNDDALRFVAQSMAMRRGGARK